LYLSKRKKIYYNYINRKSNKSVLVFLHGLGGDTSAWKATLKHFKTHPILYQDLRGHGKSQVLGSYKLEDFAQDLNEILHKEKIKKQIILIGHSMGGMISLVFYKLFKKKVKKIILINTSYDNIAKTSSLNFLQPFENTIKKLIQKMRVSKKEDPKLINYKKIKGRSDIMVFFKGFFKNTKIKLKCLKGMMNHAVFPTLKSIKIPTLIIGGKKDLWFPNKTQRLMHRYIKKSKLKMLNTTHISIISKPKRVSKEIKKFVENEN
jgi:3-oxoadipate enol-lactonase